MVGACVEGEQHEVGIRMVCDIFEMKDWNAYYLGANVPTESIVDVVKRLQPQVLVLSASLTKAIFPCKEIIRIVKEVNPNLAVLVGGRAFDVDPTLWDFVNADGYSLNALEAVSVASELIIL
jgi:methanogenic corrinoid protein MtbC1